MTSPEVDKYLARKRTILVPVGSTEQHGALAPTGCDHLVAEAVCIEVGKRNEVMVAPVLPYGQSESHMGFPGTVSLSGVTMALMVRDMVESLYRTGFRDVLFLSGHGGNRGPVMTGLAGASRSCPDAVLRYLGYWELPGILEAEKRLFGEGRGLHATAAEVSMIMVLREGFEPPRDPLTRTARPKLGEVVSASRWKERYPDGPCDVDPLVISREKGREFFELLVEKLIEEIAEAGE
jgi:creatinine amidohydrolase